MPSDSFVDTLKRELNPKDFAEGMYAGVIGDPVKALRQVAGAKVELADGDDQTFARTAGKVVGTVVEVALLSRVGGGLLRPIFGKATTQDLAMEGFAGRSLAAERANAIGASGARMAFGGAVNGGLLTPSSEDRSLLTGRLENALVQGASIGVMGSTARSLELVQGLKQGSLWSSVLRNGIAGGVSGIPAAYGSTYFSENRLAKPEEVLGYVGQNAAMGAAFGTIDHGIRAITGSSSAIRLQWRLEEKADQARTKMYSALNDYGLRHPFRAIGDRIYGTEVQDPTSRAPLTAENNPIVAFHSELPEFFQKVDAMHDKIYSNEANKDFYALHLEREELFTDISARLLRMWHGTAESPGIKWHTDEQLATKEFPKDRVAEVRRIFGLRGRSASNDDNPFHEAIESLFPEESNVAWRGHEILDHIGYGKERFFGYDEKAMIKRMQMPRPWSTIDSQRPAVAPTTWSPLDPSFVGPRYFHGTSVKSLPAVLEEGAVRPSQWIRLRNIEQKTGESARSEWANPAVSMTRAFGHAYAYTRTTPPQVDDFPIIYGMRSGTGKHAWYAGARGEERVNKLRIGSSWWNIVGLKKPDVTHIFGPSSQLDYLNALLRSRRVNGVQLVGFNDLPEQQWLPKPSDEELRKQFPDLR